METILLIRRQLNACLLFVSLFLFTTCNNEDCCVVGPKELPISTSDPIKMSTDKATYNPGEAVMINAAGNVPTSAKIRYRHGIEIIHEENFSSSSWSWQPPSTDFKGYMIEVFRVENGVDVIYGAVAVDVSSDWKKFPRYGFLSSFGQMSGSDMDEVIENLNRHHINGIQFYDWTEKHHKPMAGTPLNPAQNWLDIANRPVFKTTVDGYISRAHEKGMKAMSYNLCYGALNDASTDGVDAEWHMYDDTKHNFKTVFDIGPFLKSPIYLMDASNGEWQNYLSERNAEMYSIFAFDGFHIDQLGDWGTKYKYAGQSINIAETFPSFIAAMKNADPNKRLVFNAVNQYGQPNVGNSTVDFLYTEVWDPNENYSDLTKIINDNGGYSNQTKKTVLAAYMNYNLANNPGSFKTPAVLFADAVIFAFGGSHLELGEHMLAKEYFPNSNLQMPDVLKKNLVYYYDFMVAYENLLREGGTWNTLALSSTDQQLTLKAWPPQTGSVSFIGKDLGNKQVLHFFNFTTNSLDWRDTNGVKITPNIIENISITCPVTLDVTKVWFASPDLNFGCPMELDFEISGGSLSFTLPSLRYWGMIVLE